MASRSPRRQDLLRLCGEPFLVRTADVDEDSITEKIMKTRGDGVPFAQVASMIVSELAETKAAAVLKDCADRKETLVLGADTIVVIDDRILGKPASKEEAFFMLKQLAGREHSVYTGVSLQTDDGKETFTSCTKVRFYPWDEEEETFAKCYVEEGSPLDKAGAYGIQDRGALLVESICGDYYTVMGLPVSEVRRRLCRFGLTGK